MKNVLHLTPLLAGLIFGCGDSCFVRGTRVLTPTGWRPIEALAMGDEVLSYSTSMSAIVVRKVARLMRSYASRVARLEAGELAIAGVTLTHPVWDHAAERWSPVVELSLGTHLLCMVPAATPQTIPLGKLAMLPATGSVEVFNLEVDGEEHNYFAEGILVHNTSPDDGGGSPPVGAGGAGGGEPFGGFCFVRGTRVLTPHGPRAIETLVAGDAVTSYDTRSKTVVTRKVAELLTREAPEVARLVAGELTLAGVSLEHPIWDETAQRWSPLAQISLSATVLGLLPGGAPRAFAITELERLRSKGPVEVFNLEVDGDEHNYFAESILVHNKSGGAGPDGGFGGTGGVGGDAPGGAPTTGGAGGSGGAGGGQGDASS
ncbi:MAG: Hint domain-containing protein [Myxococcales bacterium]|nr:Hint domain-containing protein [Myxococcales bacterium]